MASHLEGCRSHTPSHPRRMSAGALTPARAPHTLSQTRADRRPTAIQPDANGLWSRLPHARTSPSSAWGPSPGETELTRGTVTFMSLPTNGAASPSTLQVAKEFLVMSRTAYGNSGAKTLPGRSYRKKDTGVPRQHQAPTATITWTLRAWCSAALHPPRSTAGQRHLAAGIC